MKYGRRLLSVVLLGLLLFSLVGCGNEKVELVDPPILKVLYEDESIDAVQGTYSWTIDNKDGTKTSVESDSADPGQLVKNTSPLIENLFSNFNIIKTENIYEFEYKAKSLNNVEIFDASDLYASLVEEIKVNIKLPFRVLNHNADMFNEDIGIYTWEYSNRKPTKNIIIEFDTSKMKVGNTEKGLYFLLGFVIIIGALIGYVYYKYKLHERV